MGAHIKPLCKLQMCSTGWKGKERPHLAAIITGELIGDLVQARNVLDLLGSPEHKLTWLKQ